MRDEGLRLQPYRDSVGTWTVGYGHNLESNSITEGAALELLQADIGRILVDLDRSFPWWTGLPDDVQRGLANMAFNLGLPRLRTFKLMLAALERGDFVRAAVEALASKWADQVGQRAVRIAALFRSST